MEQAWNTDCHEGIENVIARFRKELPNWWFSLGECQVSCDASCAPTSHSPDMQHIPVDDRFNSGFHADVPQPSKLTDALLIVMFEALAAKHKAEGDLKKSEKMQEAADLILKAKGMID